MLITTAVGPVLRRPGRLRFRDHGQSRVESNLLSANFCVEWLGRESLLAIEATQSSTVPGRLSSRQAASFFALVLAHLHKSPAHMSRVKDDFRYGFMSYFNRAR